VFAAYCVLPIMTKLPDPEEFRAAWSERGYCLRIPAPANRESYDMKNLIGGLHPAIVLANIEDTTSGATFGRKHANRRRAVSMRSLSPRQLRWRMAIVAVLLIAAIAALLAELARTQP